MYIFFIKTKSRQISGLGNFDELKKSKQATQLEHMKYRVLVLHLIPSTIELLNLYKYL